MRFVVIGDSFSEGVGDDDADGNPRGWSDLVAAGLASSLDEQLEYANLAIRGKLLAPIVEEQLPRALALRPTLVSFNGGGNDVMRPGADPAALVALTKQAIERCQAQGVPLLLLSGADPSGQLPAGKIIHRRGAQLAQAVADLAARYGATYVDNWSDEEIRRPVYWSPDRLHLNSMGHQRVAARVLATLGARFPPHWLTPATAPDRAAGVRENAVYYRQHVVPWVRRRLGGQSSGDGRPAKHADWVVVPATDPWPPA